MRYLGGKFRQSKQIVAAVERLHPNFKVHVEPFCGALWSAVAMMKRFPDRRYVLNDINPYLICTWRAGKDGWNPPKNPTEKDHRWYKKHRPVDDPMTGYLGFAWSFAGQFFGVPSRTNGKFKGSYASTQAKINLLRETNVKFTCGPFTKVPLIKGASIYLDPPYEGRNHQSKLSQGFDYDVYHNYAESLAKHCVVLATSFTNERKWKVLHNYGNTVVSHYAGGPKDATVELLMRVS